MGAAPVNVRRGDIRRPEVAMDHAAHEAEKTALRLRIAVLEAALQRKTEALRRWTCGTGCMRTVELSAPVTLHMIVYAFYSPVAVRDVDGFWWWLAGVNADGSIHLEPADI